MYNHNECSALSKLISRGHCPCAILGYHNIYCTLLGFVGKHDNEHTQLVPVLHMYKEHKIFDVCKILMA